MGTRPFWGAQDQVLPCASTSSNTTTVSSLIGARGRSPRPNPRGNGTATQHGSAQKPIGLELCFQQGGFPRPRQSRKTSGGNDLPVLCHNRPTGAQGPRFQTCIGQPRRMGEVDAIPMARKFADLLQAEFSDLAAIQQHVGWPFQGVRAFVRVSPQTHGRSCKGTRQSCAAQQGSGSCLRYGTRSSRLRAKFPRGVGPGRGPRRPTCAVLFLRQGIHSHRQAGEGTAARASLMWKSTPIETCRHKPSGPKPLLAALGPLLDFIFCPEGLVLAQGWPTLGSKIDPAFPPQEDRRPVRPPNRIKRQCPNHRDHGGQRQPKNNTPDKGRAAFFYPRPDGFIFPFAPEKYIKKGTMRKVLKKK